jgi:hypothetical protein
MTVRVKTWSHKVDVAPNGTFVLQWVIGSSCKGWEEGRRPGRVFEPERLILEANWTELQIDDVKVGMMSQFADAAPRSGYAFHPDHYSFRPNRGRWDVATEGVTLTVRVTNRTAHTTEARFHWVGRADDSWPINDDERLEVLSS